MCVEQVGADQTMPDHVATALRIARRLAAALCASAALAGCAPTQAPETAQAATTPMRTEVSEIPTICRPDPALLTPPSAPDCKFGRPELKTVDPDQWARLSVEYERQCYLRAERTVRERLRLLQLSARCDAATGRR
jgi:hypothetical protein